MLSESVFTASSARLLSDHHYLESCIARSKRISQRDEMMSGAQQHDPQTTTTHNDNNGSGQPQPDAGGSYHPFQNNNISHSDDGSSSNPAVPQWGSFVSHKRKEDSLLTGDGGDYHQHDSMSDGDDDECDGSIAADGSKRRGGAVGGSNKRVLKNAREKERSSRIAKQIGTSKAPGSFRRKGD